MTRRPLVVFVAANEAGARTGNERTLRRLARRLRGSGVAVLVVRPGDRLEEVAARIDAVGGHLALVHAFHARRSGPRGAELAARLGVPSVVGLTGTDLGRDIHDPERAPVVLDALRRAAVVTCGNDDEARTVARLVDPAPPVFVLPKGIDPPPEPPAPRLERTAGEALVLQIAHVRRVKGTAVAVGAVRRLAERRAVRLVVLGSVLEPEYLPEVVAAAGGEDAWDQIHRDAVEPGEVPDFVVAADVVLNTSDGEGGSNAVLEAMSLGRAVLASAVPGNLAYVGATGERGWTYPVRVCDDGTVVHDEDALVAALDALLADQALRSRLGTAAAAWVRATHSPDAEREAVLAAYAVASPAAFSTRP